MFRNIKNLKDNYNMNAFYIVAIAISLLVLANVAKVYGDDSNRDIEIGNVITEGLNECSELQSDECVGVMHALNNICASAYFEPCFYGDLWAKFMDHLAKEYKHQGLDDFVTVNNEHFNN